MKKYLHDTYTHNFESPFEIVSILNKALHPKTVVDIGCGTGTFLNQFKKMGVQKVLGIDGPWAKNDLLYQNLEEHEFIEMNLEGPIKLGTRFDLALCLEVAEHLHEQYADNLITALIQLSDIIIFSAAIPFQGGQNHINEQWPDYWKKKFESNNYKIFDVLRPILWENRNVQWWYKQNIFIASNKTALFDEHIFERYYNNKVLDNYVHPDLYIEKCKQLENTLSGRESFIFYLKLIIKKMLGIRSTHQKVLT